MNRTRSFRFADDDLNRRLISLLRQHKFRYSLDDTNTIHYLLEDEEVVENELIPSVRQRVFPSWQVLTCPDDWAERYKAYMTEHGIPFAEELADGQLWFLIPRKYRPHLWRLERQKKGVGIESGSHIHGAH